MGRITIAYSMAGMEDDTNRKTEYAHIYGWFVLGYVFLKFSAEETLQRNQIQHELERKLICAAL